MTGNEKRRIWNLNHNWRPPSGKRENCGAWKGGKKITDDGYSLIYLPEHPMSRKDGYVLEHRMVMSDSLCRLLSKKEVVHHINENKLDNRIENLKLYATSGKHIVDNHFKLNQGLNNDQTNCASTLRKSHNF